MVTMVRPNWAEVRNGIELWLASFPENAARVTKEDLRKSHGYIRTTIIPTIHDACPVELLDYGEVSGIEIHAGPINLESDSDVESLGCEVVTVLYAVSAGKIQERQFFRGKKLLARKVEIELPNGLSIVQEFGVIWVRVFHLEEKIVRYSPYVIST